MNNKININANMEKSKKELKHATHNKNLLEQRKKLVEQKNVQKVMSQLKISVYNRDVVRNVNIG